MGETTKFDIVSFLKKAVAIAASDVHLAVDERPAIRKDGRIIKIDMPPLTEDDILDALTRLRVIYKNIMKLDYDNKRTRTMNEINGADAVKEKKPIEHFSEFYELQNGQPLTDEQTAFVNDIIEQIWEEDK